MNISINTHEFGCLIESAFNSMTGLRYGIQEKAILEYHNLNDIQKRTLWNWIHKCGEPTYEISQRLVARYDPNNQFRITISDGSKQESRDMFMFKEQYSDDMYTYAPKELIINIEKI